MNKYKFVPQNNTKQSALIRGSALLTNDQKGKCRSDSPFHSFQFFTKNNLQVWGGGPRIQRGAPSLHHSHRKEKIGWNTHPIFLNICGNALPRKVKSGQQVYLGNTYSNTYNTYSTTRQKYQGGIRAADQNSTRNKSSIWFIRWYVQRVR